MCSGIDKKDGWRVGGSLYPLLIEHDMRRLTKDIAVAGGYQ